MNQYPAHLCSHQWVCRLIPFSLTFSRKENTLTSRVEAREEKPSHKEILSLRSPSAKTIPFSYGTFRSLIISHFPPPPHHPLPGPDRELLATHRSIPSNSNTTKTLGQHCHPKMPFDFQKYDEKCRGLTPDELQREWQHYTRLITGAATSTTVSGLAIPLTAGVSTIGVALAAPAIHNARKKREIVERHLNYHQTTHVTRKRDVAGGVAVSGTIGVLTLGISSLGADAIAQQGAEHGISAVVENDTAIKVVAHAAMDGAGMAVEHMHTSHLKKRDAHKAFQAAGVFDAVTNAKAAEAKAAEAGHAAIPAYNPQAWTAGSGSHMSFPPPPPYSPGMTVPMTGTPAPAYTGNTMASSTPYQTGAQTQQYVLDSTSNRFLITSCRVIPRRPVGSISSQGTAATAESTCTTERKADYFMTPTQYSASPAPASTQATGAFDMSPVAGALPTWNSGAPNMPQEHRTQTEAKPQATITNFESVELPAEYAPLSCPTPSTHYSAPSESNEPYAPTDSSTNEQGLSRTLERDTAKQEVSLTSSETVEVTCTFNGFPPPTPAPVTPQCTAPSYVLSPAPSSISDVTRRHSVTPSMSPSPAPQPSSQYNTHRHSIAQPVQHYAPTPSPVPSSTPAAQAVPYFPPPHTPAAAPSTLNTVSVAATPPLPYFPPPPTSASPAASSQPKVHRPVPLHQYTHSNTGFPAPMQTPSQQPASRRASYFGFSLPPMQEEPKYEAVPVPQAYHPQRPQSQIFPPTPMSLPTSPDQQQPQQSSPGYFPQSQWGMQQPGYNVNYGHVHTVYTPPENQGSWR